jgi:hypothetical protein
MNVAQFREKTPLQQKTLMLLPTSLEGMSREGLIARPVIDRNGVHTTRWTKPDDAAVSAGSPFPAPGLGVSQDSDSVTDDLKAKIIAVLKTSRGDTGVRSVLDTDAVWKAHRERDVPLLEAMLLCAAHADPSLSEVLILQRMLKRHGVSEPTRLLTPDALNMAHRMMVALLEIQYAQGVEQPVNELRYLALTADPADQPLIERIIVERSITDPDEVQTMLDEMKRDAASLSEGKL